MVWFQSRNSSELAESAGDILKTSSSTVDAVLNAAIASSPHSTPSRHFPAMKEEAQILAGAPPTRKGTMTSEDFDEYEILRESKKVKVVDDISTSLTIS